MLENTIQPEVPRGWFTAVGIIQIALGVLLALMMAAAVLMSLSSPFFYQQPAGQRWFSLVFSLLTYGGLSGFFIICGIGIMKPRRWAHRLMNSFSWLWLTAGVIGIIYLILCLPGFLQQFLPAQGLPDSTVKVAFTVVLSSSTLLYLVLPGLFVLFYSRHSVQRAVDSRDMAPSWTDTCPAPVMGLAFFYGLGVLMVAANIPLAIFPFFGILLTGLQAVLMTILSTVLLAWLAYGVYKLQTAAFWVSALAAIVAGVSAAVTFSRMDLKAFYAAAGFAPDQADIMMQMGYSSSLVVWGSVASAIILLGYLWYIRKYFSLNTVIGKRP